jgi:ribonuclease J
MKKSGLKKPQLRVIPLGGLGEIGMNLMVFEFEDDLLVVDCGLMFPEDYMLGVDLVLPDFSYLEENRDRVKAYLITHGHEDHTGALPYIIPKVPAPVYGTALTLGLIRDKLEEFDLAKTANLEEVKAGQKLSFGNLQVELIRVSHSIADGLGLAIRSPVGTVIHSGDFKLDPTPVDGKRMDLNAFARHGEHGVLALFSDSTNVEQEGYTPSEREVGRALSEILQEAKGRVLVALFASNIHRIQQVMDSACSFGRKLIVHGRSMEANTRIASRLGYLQIPRNLLVPISELSRLQDHRIMVLTTGSQGEPLSVMARVARGEHKQIKIKPGDTVVFSSKFIPGHEKAIDHLINELYRRGADVIYEKVSEIHVSGHASQEELKLMISLTRPRYFVPIHGEYRHLVRHVQLAMSMGIPRDRCLLAEDGDIITFDEKRGRISGKIETGPLLVDGKSMGEIGDSILRQRRRLGQEGVLVARIVMDARTRKLIQPVEFWSRGFIFEEESQSLFDAARQNLEDEFRRFPMKVRSDPDALREEVRISVRRFFNKAIQRRPVVVPVLVEV